MEPSIIIPGHDEEPVIRRTLEALLDGLPTNVQVLVMCNGCTDATAQVARELEPRIEVHEIPVASKVRALNEGDALARGFPRLYLDADVSLTGSNAVRILDALSEPQALSAESGVEYVLDQSSVGVRAFYAVWTRLHGGQVGDMGTGIYCLSEAGRGRFGPFPEVISDDGFVRSHFTPEEVVRVPAASTRVWAPRSLAGLIAARGRVRRGIAELGTRFPELWSNKRRVTLPLWRKLLRLGPGHWLLLPFYLLVQLRIRRWGRLSQGWNRDDARGA